MPDDQDDIRIADISVSYTSSNGVVPALEHISMAVRRGEMCCIVGPSGCGKSTLLKAILGLVPYQQGTIDLNKSRLREGIAFVQQDCPLLPWRTAMQNACLGAEIKDSLNSAVVGRVQRTLIDLGLSGFENNFMSELSGGMRQRVAIARALESCPALLFCDEPFSAVDFVGRLALTSKFKYLCRVGGITTVFVTHNIEEAIFLGDTVVVMTGRPGRIKRIYRPELSIGSEDAVKCRKSPEFPMLFQNIWTDLEDNHE
jgi:ABC-type nitrate/sulfonate/bicarbonate transport system ATPase subunit